MLAPRAAPDKCAHWADWSIVYIVPSAQCLVSRREGTVESRHTRAAVEAPSGLGKPGYNDFNHISYWPILAPRSLSFPTLRHNHLELRRTGSYTLRLSFDDVSFGCVASPKTQTREYAPVPFSSRTAKSRHQVYLARKVQTYWTLSVKNTTPRSPKSTGRPCSRVHWTSCTRSERLAR
jgi:hypothetical protein